MSKGLLVAALRVTGVMEHLRDLHRDLDDLGLSRVEWRQALRAAQDNYGAIQRELIYELGRQQLDKVRGER